MSQVGCEKETDGTPYEVKVSRTVWARGKSNTCSGRLPIRIIKPNSSLC